MAASTRWWKAPGPARSSSSSSLAAAQAHAWYKSDAYQEILALRTDNSRSDIILVNGVGPDHRATDVLAG